MRTEKASEEATALLTDLRRKMARARSLNEIESVPFTNPEQVPLRKAAGCRGMPRAAHM
jgi:hypothetical protein